MSTETLHADRIACTPAAHVLTTHNPWTGHTWCRCGDLRISGEHTVRRERYVYDSHGRGAKILGYERYTLTACGCHPGGQVPA